MFRTLWLTIVITCITLGLIWLINNNGSLLINWLGYEITIDILSAIVITSFILFVLFTISYILARLLAVRFPKFLRRLFKKSYVKSLEKIIYNNNQAFEISTHLMLALENDDNKNATKLSKKLFKLLKNNQFEAFLQAKLAFKKQDYAKAADFFAKIDNNNDAKLLLLKSKLELALKNKDDASAVTLTQQISSLKNDK